MAKEKNLTNVTSVAAADFVRVVTSAGASVKGTMENLAKSLLTTAFSGLSLGGSQQSVKDAIDALNSKMPAMAFSKAAVTTEARAFTLGSGYRGTLFVYDSSPQRNGVYNVFSTASGNVDIKPISAAIDLTIDTSVTSTISLAATSGSRIVVFLTVQGNVPV